MALELGLHLEAFRFWLPRELEYSVRKAGYDEKVEDRARRSADDRGSWYGFLGQEWHTHRLMSQAGNHYSPQAGDKTAQLQLAKFAAGLHDKVAVAYWLQTHGSATEADFMTAGRRVILLAGSSNQMEASEVRVNEILGQPFDETPFAAGLKRLMAQAVEIDGLKISNARLQLAEGMVENAIGLADLATQCYRRYAGQHLTPAQAELPVSQFETGFTYNPAGRQIGEFYLPVEE